MTTVINNPGNGEDSSGGIGVIVSVIILLIAGALFFVYGLPMMRNSETPKENSIDINVKLPANEGDGTKTQ